MRFFKSLGINIRFCYKNSSNKSDFISKINKTVLHILINYITKNEKYLHL